ncbi:Maf1 regulator-domain-containing protein [Sordaria brevicollis]|uniref:Repressor of RNA polymerase III transcription MAF1 n=1 Tax=Sordaria brevicollis TaxID=83679 RepID=A0AAE0UFX6_SORBR|nr:Maf1 regulator-domain-containing protein [Sordaria brevicollis]
MKASIRCTGRTGHRYHPNTRSDVVTSALNFDTPDCHITGSCDLYTTKAAGSDKRLYKNIQQSLQTQHDNLIKFGKSLSPPQRESIADTINFERSSPFGSLNEKANRNTYAYLIATLNASHPDYDFSNVLRPDDFKREKELRRVMAHIDSTLQSVRPNSSYLDVSMPRMGSSPAAASSFGSSGLGMAPVWGPATWASIDKEMDLKDCSIFSYQPVDAPFDEEEGAIWALHYFFFNKTLKRVCYLYVRGMPVMSHSPRIPGHHAIISAKGGLVRPRRALYGIDEELDDAGANKRARYWLGDQFAERVMADDDEMEADDGLIWNRDADGDVNYQYHDDEYDDDYDVESLGDYEDDEEDEDEDDNEIDVKTAAAAKAGGGSSWRSQNVPYRGVSEDIASRMEIDV